MAVSYSARMKRKDYILYLCLFLTINCFSQEHFTILNGKKTEKIKFELINNVIIIPAEINGVPLSFILDSGASKAIVFNFFDASESLNSKKIDRFFLRGLGGGNYVEAIKSKENVFQLGNVISMNQDLFMIQDDQLDFAPKLGVPIHGIIGYDLFKDFIVEINYSSKHIKFTKSEYYKSKTCRRCETVPLEFHNNKPYLNASVAIDEKQIPVKLLIDTGGSDALWIFEDEENDLVSGDDYFEDFLGYALSGKVFGKRSKIESFNINSFKLDYALVAYPDSTSISLAKKIKNRNGSVGGEILKRFNIVFDYKNKTLRLKKNANFNNQFSYNKSGIILEQDGFRVVKESTYSLVDGRIVSQSMNSSITTVYKETERYKVRPAFVIAELRPGSPAKLTGLQLGDIILKINNKDAHNYTLQELMSFFYGKDRKEIKVLVDRQGQILKYAFYLKSRLK